MKISIVILLLFCCPFNTFSQQNLTFNHGGLTRNYILYLPNNLPPDAPLVFVLHGYTGQANWIMNYSGFNQIANTEGFAVCYPWGITDQWGDYFWNVGYDFHWNETVDDVAFLDSLAQYLQIQHNLSASETFCTGFSNGGDMSFMLACQAPQTFKAVAPVGGAIMESTYVTCDASVPVPVFITNGTNDSITLWNGDINNIDGWGAYYDTPFGFDYWVQTNACTQFAIDTFPDVVPFDGSIVIAKKYANGINGNKVWLYKVDGAGHQWPGVDGNMDINLSDEIWLFFSLYNAPLGISKKEKTEVLIYPNPTKSYVTIKRNDATVEKYQLFSIVGELLRSGKINSETFNLNVSELPNNIYILKIGNKEYQVVKQE